MKCQGWLKVWHVKLNRFKGSLQETGNHCYPVAIKHINGKSPSVNGVSGRPVHKGCNFPTASHV